MLYEQVEEPVQYIRKHVKTELLTGIILGSGLSSLVEMMEDEEVPPYQDILHFPQSRVTGRTGNLIFGRVGDQRLIVMQGRFHYCGGFSMKEATYPIYVMKLFDIRDLTVTSACGGINSEFTPGGSMITDDSISSLDIDPLIGDNDECLGPRFPDISESYSTQLCEKTEQMMDQLTIPYCHGAYTPFQGPYYETAAKIRMYAKAGSNAIGMPAMPKIIAANYLGIRMLEIVCTTNMATSITKGKHSHEEVVKVVNKNSVWLCTRMEVLLEEW